MCKQCLLKRGEACRGVEDVLVFETGGGDDAEAFRSGDMRGTVQWIIVRLSLGERGSLLFRCPFAVVVHFVGSTGFSRNGVGLAFKLDAIYCDGSRIPPEGGTTNGRTD